MGLIPENKNRDLGIKKYESIVWFIFGVPMSGKSAFAASFPKPLWFNTDGNINQYDIPAISLSKGTYEIPNPMKKDATIQVSGWTYFKRAISELLQSPNLGGYKTLIFDLVEDFYEIAREHLISQKKGAKDEHDLGSFGAGFKMVEDEFLAIAKGLSDLSKIGVNIIFISHTKIKDIPNLNPGVAELKEYEYGSSLRPKVESKLKGMVQVCGRTGIQKVSIKTPSGPKLKEQYILKINEVNSIAGNRFNLPFNEIDLSYAGWINKINQSIKK